MVKPKRLGHLVLSVRDLDTSVRFYEDVLGLHVTNVWPDRVTFMSSGEDSSHELALISVGPDAPGPEQRRVGLNHFAWEMETFEELQKLYLDLKQKHVKVSMVDDHGISLGVYFFDPDGNMIEAFNELPRDQWPNEGDLFDGTFPHTLAEPASSAP